MSIIDRFFFRKKKYAECVSFEALQTDIHSHLIPGIDDGVKDIETALDLIRKMKALGFRKLIITPHVMSDIYKNNKATIYEGLEKLKQAVDHAEINIELEAAAEYQADDGLLGLLEKDELISFGDRYLMLELPYFSAPQNLNTIFFELQLAGYNIILAHPERYIYWQNQFSKFEDLKSRGIFFQLNTISLSGYYSYPTKKTANKLIDAQMIDFLGSDLHNHNSFSLLESVMYESGLKKLLASGKLKNHLI
jgi:protein-tyrosine phosphatase